MEKRKRWYFGMCYKNGAYRIRLALKNDSSTWRDDSYSPSKEELKLNWQQ